MTYTQKRNSILAAIIFLFGLLIGGRLMFPLLFKEGIKGRLNNLNLVTAVIDGDTFKIETGQKVRILTIDAPEKGECYYEQSRQALKYLIEGQSVRLDKDVSEIDQYDRLLRHVILIPTDSKDSNIIISQYLVANGYAYYVPSPPDNRYRDLIVTAKEDAKDNRSGVWGACKWPVEELEKEERQEQDTAPTNPTCIIKGNISEKGYGKTYLILGCDNYDSVKIDMSKGEQYFCTEQEAIEAGFRKATNCP